MDCTIEAIDCNDTDIAPHILRYIYRSRGFAGTNVSGIFKVYIRNEETGKMELLDRLPPDIPPGNRLPHCGQH